MDNREKKLRRVALKCGDFARQLSYHHALDTYRDNFKLNFWIVMFNNSIDLAVLDWCHLFGSHKDDLHWKKVIIKSDDFRAGLFNFIGTDEEKWRNYRESIKNYRDKDVAHLEIRPRSFVPEMGIALQAAAYYYLCIQKELSNYPNYSKWPKDLIEYHNQSLAQTKLILTKAYESSKDIKEIVY